MEERTTGLRRTLGSPAVYSWLQNLLGARSVREHLVREHLRPAPGERILDLGCGPGHVVELLFDVDYVGVDRNPSYIEAARAHGHERAEFHCADLRSFEPPPRSFDAVLALGVLHHLDEQGASRLFDVAAAALAEDGRLITLDPAVVAGQAAIARWLISRDRGRNVRDPEALKRLASERFASVKVDCRHDLARVPYTHTVLSCTKPRPGTA